MEERQDDRYSRRRDSLIGKMRRENPLRRIEGEEHARAILAASERHNTTDYEYQLEHGREEATMGNIERDEVKNFARMAINEYTNA